MALDMRVGARACNPYVSLRGSGHVDEGGREALNETQADLRRCDPQIDLIGSVAATCPSLASLEERHRRIYPPPNDSVGDC